MKRFSLLLVLFLYVFSTCVGAATNNCGRTGIEVLYEDSHDKEMACVGIERALKFFSSQGYNITGSIRVKFLDHLDIDERKDCKEEIAESQACGYYRSRNGTCKITSWKTMLKQGITLFGKLEMTEELFISLIVHEVSHCLHSHVIKSNEQVMERSLTEFIAYAAQIATMKEPDRSVVLKLFPAKTFDSCAEINSMNHAMNPHQFGVMSYRYFEQHPEIIGLILSGEIKSSDSMLMFF